jgi:branched-subunit amino acid transport protein
MSDDLWLLLTIVCCGLSTLALRLSFIVGGAQFKPGRRIRAVLSYVPPAVLAALIAPEILLRQGAVDFSLDNPRLLAAAVAIAVAFFTRSVLATIACGLIALWVVQRWIL